MRNSTDNVFQWGDGFFVVILITLLITAVFWVVSALLGRKIIPAVIAHISEEKHPIPVTLLQGFRRPLVLLLKFLGIFIALWFLCAQMDYGWLPKVVSDLTTALPPIMVTAIRVSLVLAVTWGLVASSSITSLLLHNARDRLGIRMSKSVSRFLAAVFNVVIILAAAIILLNEFNYNVSALIAGLGLGGLTIALAAQDSASNFFGGLVLVTDNPFEIGDWISCNGIEGTVEDISLRSTKIREGSGALTVMPNATLAAAPISNWGNGMKTRRAEFTLQLDYSTPRDKLRTYISELHTILETDHDIVNKSIVVRFYELGESSLNIKVRFDTSNPGYSDHLRIRERVNLALMEAAEKQGIGFAFPTRTVYIRPQATTDASPPD